MKSGIALLFFTLLASVGLAQFQFDGTQLACINDPANNDGIINTIGDSLELTITLGGLDLYSDAVVVAFCPISGLGTILTPPQTFSCGFGEFDGYSMQVTIVHDSGIVTANPDSMKIRARYRFRPVSLCGTNLQATYRVFVRAVRSATQDTLCGSSPVFSRAVPCSVSTGCGYIRFEELCGFVDGIIAIGDRVFLDTAEVAALDAALPPPAGGAHDTVYVIFRTLNCPTITTWRDTVTIVGDLVTVRECIRENGFCGDSFQVRVAYWHGAWPPTTLDSTKRISSCVRPVDNVRPQVVGGMVDSFKILNGNAIANDSLVGCCDTLRIFMATDSQYVGGAYPFNGDVDGTSYTDACGASRVHNFDMSWIGVWFGDLMGEARETDTSGYIHNSEDMGLLCPADTFLWMSNRFSWTAPDSNNLMWIDIPFCSEDWDSLQICLLESGEGLQIGEDTLFLWGFDDAGNRSLYNGGLRGLPWADTSLCIDVWPPLAELGSDIYHSDGYCTKRFSPYDSADFAHLYTNLTPDSIEWIKCGVDTKYDADDMWSVFNDVYMIGFDIRVMPEDTAPLTRLNYVHPKAPIPMDPTLDTLRWLWTVEQGDTCALFRWWGKRGTDSIDAVLGTGDLFWKCASGGGLTVGITFARWMDAAGCNKILGWDYDGSTNISQNFTTRNQLRAVVDMCIPGVVLPGDTLICSNLPFNSGGSYDPPGPLWLPSTYLWVGPNGGPNDDPVVRFRPKRNFAQNPFDECLIEDTLFYRIRMDTVDLIYALGAWPGVNDSVRWYSGETYPHRRWGSSNPHAIWTPITFSAGDMNGPEIAFSWGHKFGVGANDYLPDGLYRLMLELRDDAGNVYRDPIYVWLNGSGPAIDSIIVCNADTVCTYNFYASSLGDTLAIWMQTDTTADQVLIDWTCVYGISWHPDMDTTFAQLVASTNTYKQWFGYLVITPDMVAPESSVNVYEIAPYESDCQKGAGGLRIINVRALDISALGDTIFSEADPQHDCDKAALDLTPCPRLIPLGSSPGYEYFYFADPDSPQPLIFGPGVDQRHAISPGKIDSMGGAGTYNAVFNWANDQVQDSIFVRLLIDSASIRPDTLDTLILQFINPTIYPPETAPRIREVRKGLFRPNCADLDGTPWPLCADVRNNQINNVGRLERDDANQALVEFRYFWNGTWFIGPGQDSLMLVPYDQQDTILIKAYVQAVDTIIQGDTTYNECPDTLYALLDVDNINPHFRSGWTGWNNPGHDPVTGSSKTVKNLGWDADGDSDPEDCGFRFSDGEHFALKVKLTEKVHEFPNSPPYFPNTDGSHHDGGGYWPLTRNWQISPIHLGTGDLFAFGLNPGDSCLVVLDSVVMDLVSVDSVYYTLYGYFDFPPAAVAYFAANPGPVDSVAMVIRSAWDEAGNPGRYNNPVFNDGLKNDACEDTTFFVTLISPTSWAGCPLVYGRPDSVLGWITAGEDDVVVRVTIIETDELAQCSPGVYADSIHVLEGDFQSITDDPNPWVIPNLRGQWFLYPIGDPNPLGWARTYTFYLRADSSDLATIHCDGDYLPFVLRFNTYAIPWPLNTRTFDECVQVDVNEPRWGQYTYLDSLHDTLPGCFDPRQLVTIVAQFTDALGDPVSCGYSPGVGVLTDMIWADLSYVTQNAALDSVVPDSVVSDIAYWTFMPDDTFACIDSSWAWIRLHALHDRLHHHDRELFLQEMTYFCSDCVPPHIQAVNVFCECDTALNFAASADSCTQQALHYLAPGASVNIVLCIADVDGDSSQGIDPASVMADLSWINSSLGWVSADDYVGEGTLVKFLFGFGECLGEPARNGSFSNYVLTNSFQNGDSIMMPFAFCDNFGNCDTSMVIIAISDTLPPIVDYVYTIGDDSIRAYVTPADQHVHIYADLAGYAADLVSAPEHVWVNMSRFWCDPDSQAAYDTVYADYVVQTGPNSYRTYWGWYPGPWVADPSSYPMPFDSLSLATDHHGVDPNWASCHTPSVGGWHDSLWFYVTDEACNVGSAFSVFEVSGVDSTVPAVDFVQIWGNGCHEGWISSTPLDSQHIEVWAFMDTVFNKLSDTLLIDSMQANLAQLSPDYAWTQWSWNLKGGAEVYGTVPNPADPVQTYWEMVGNRLVAKWVFLTARDLGCENEVVVGVKAIRSISRARSHSYYTDVEYGRARVDTTRPVIYDMRMHSATTSVNETTWVSPNVPIYVDVWVYDTNCDTIADHLSFDLTNDIGSPGPFITFCNPAGGFDTIWTWDATSYTILHVNPDSLDKAWIMLRWIGYPRFNDTCNHIDLDNITGCIEAHIEDCLSNPAAPMQRQVTTDDRPPEYVMSNSWGDYTHVTGFPGDPDSSGIDSVLVLQHGAYGPAYDSLLTVVVIVDNVPGDTLISWAGTYINFDPFLTASIRYLDEVWFNIDGHRRDSLVWRIPLYDGGDPLFNTSIPSGRYWFPLILSDAMMNSTGDAGSTFTLFCDDLDSAITFTIQNWNTPNPGMILLCDSNTVAGSDTDVVDRYNMALWNNEMAPSPDTVKRNLFKIWWGSGGSDWAWYSHADSGQTRFFIFVEEIVSQSDGIDNDADGRVDEVGEGVDFHTADLRINGFPQVAQVDSMNVEGAWINYLWFADNFSEQRYDVDLFISDIYGHRDTLKCGDYHALQFYEDETCPYGDELFFYGDLETRQMRSDNDLLLRVSLEGLNVDDPIFVFNDFDSISLTIRDPVLLVGGQPGSGPDLDTTTIDSIDFNTGQASMIELLDPNGDPVVGFVQRFMRDYNVFDTGALMLVDPTGVALDGLSDGIYTIRTTLLDRVGNSCVHEWTFTLERGESAGYLALVRPEVPGSPVLSINAGLVECPETKSLTYRFKNFGSDSLGMSAPSLVSGSDFVLAGDCPGFLVLGPDQMSACSVTVTFEPQSDGVRQDTIRIYSNAVNAIGSYVKIPLRGERTSTPSAPRVVISTRGDDACLSWRRVANSGGGCSINVTRYLVFHSEGFAGPYWYLGSTADTSFTHVEAVRWARTEHYHVIASTAPPSLLLTLPPSGQNPPMSEEQVLGMLRQRGMVLERVGE